MKGALFHAHDSLIGEVHVWTKCFLVKKNRVRSDQRTTIKNKK